MSLLHFQSVYIPIYMYIQINIYIYPNTHLYTYSHMYTYIQYMNIYHFTRLPKSGRPGKRTEPIYYLYNIYIYVICLCHTDPSKSFRSP